MRDCNKEWEEEAVEAEKNKAMEMIAQVLHKKLCMGLYIKRPPLGLFIILCECAK